jgi:diguanylate cyclase
VTARSSLKWHPAGDAVLQGLAKQINGTLRKSDVACRFGGEEFVVILPDTGPSAAQVLVERLRADIEAAHWPRHPERKVTVSIGVAGSEGGASVAPGEWVEAADKALYQAKVGGRNSVVMIEISPDRPKLAEAS